MMMLFSILNLVFILIIIVFIFNMVSKVRIPSSKALPVVSIYLAFLLISVPLFYAVANPFELVQNSDPNTTGETVWVEYDRRINEFYTAFHNGRLEEYKGAAISGQWSFDYEQERLLVAISGNRSYNTMIAVKQKDGHDGKVEIASYTAVPPFAQIAVADPPEVRLVGNRLEIIPPQPKHVEMIRFNHDFTFAQFTGLGMVMQSRGYFYVEQQVLYIQAPHDLVIDTDNSTVHNLLKIKI